MARWPWFTEGDVSRRADLVGESLSGHQADVVDPRLSAETIPEALKREGTDDSTRID